MSPHAEPRSIVDHALTFLYDRVAGELEPEAGGGSEADITRWIRHASTQAATTGFLTNLGGLATLPIAIPANLAGTAAVQLRMVARIAAARGYDVHSDEVRTFVFACLLGNAAVDVLRGAGIRIGLRASGAAVARLNQTVLTRLLVRFGALGAGSAIKVVPLVSGLIGGGLDMASTRVVGAAARRVFVRRDPPVSETALEASPSAGTTLVPLPAP